MGKQSNVRRLCKPECPQRCKNPKHKWEFRLDLPPGPDGKRRRIARTGFDSADAAKEARDEMLRKQHDGTLEADLRKEKVADYLHRWLDAKVSAESIRPATARSYRGHIDNYLIPAFGNVLLRDLKSHHIDQMLKGIRKANADKPKNLRVSATSENLILATLRAAIRDGIKAGQLSRDATLGVHRSGKAGERRDTWSPEQFAKFRTWMEAPTDTSDHSHAARLAPLVLFAVGTGMRLGEICGLRWEDVDFEAGFLTVRQQAQLQGTAVVFQPVKTKAGQDRWIPLAGWVPDVLKAWKAQQSRERLAAGEAWTNERGLVFTDPMGGPLRPNNVSKTFSRMAERAGLPRVVFHSLRHLAARIMLQNGLPLPVVSKLLGHSTIKVTNDLYFDLVKDDRLKDDITAAYSRAFGA